MNRFLFLKKYSLLLVFLVLTLSLTLSSTWFTTILPLPSIVDKGLTICVYLPFFSAVIWKLITDIRKLKKHGIDPASLVYYAFCLYYCVISIIRFVGHMEVKENLYFTIVLLGSLAVFFLIRDGQLRLSQKELSGNLIGISLYLVVYRLLYSLVGSHFFLNQPINTNLLTGSLGLLLPFLLHSLCSEETEKKQLLLSGIAVCTSLVVILATGARAIFLLSIFSVALGLIGCIGSKKALLRLVASVGTAAVIITILAAVNYGTVRYALYRETGLNISTLFSTSQDTPAPELPEVENPIQNSALEQISRSDNMRRDLMQWGISEIEKNSWIGTGNVLFLYVINEEYAFQQSSHNFLIETLICYGVIGLLLIGALVVLLFLQTNLFGKGTGKLWKCKLTMIGYVFFFFAFGFVQPTVYAPMLCLLFAALLAVTRQSLTSIPENS